MRAVGSTLGTLGSAVNAFEKALDNSLTHASLATSFRRPGLDGSPLSRWTWNLGKLVRQKSGRSGGMINITCQSV